MIYDKQLHEDDAPDAGSPPEVASELNNLLQIIGGTTDLLGNIWDGTEGAERYLAMLRFSIARAAKVTTQLVKQAGGATAGVLLSPCPEIVAPLEVAPIVETPARPQLLIVDDEPVALELFQQLLELENYEVSTADSAFKALDLLTREPDRFHLVLLDYSMPFMNGEETFRRIRAIAPGMRVILTTGFVQQHVLDAMFAEGLAAFVSKPVPPQELTARIAEVLERTGGNSEPCPLDGIAAAI